MSFTSVVGGLAISDNYALISLTGLDNVASIGGNLIVKCNNSLLNLTGLNNVTSIGGDFWIRDNHALISLTGLDNLISIGGDFNIGGYSEESGNSSLINLAELDNVTSIGGIFRISHNEALSSLTGLDNVQAETISDLIIYENSSLSTCEVYSVCSYLVNPNGTIDIHDNAPGCNSQAEVEDICFCLPEGITFSTQEQIDSFQVNYPSCLNILGDVTISGDDIINLNGLVYVTYIEGSLFIVNNPVITDLWGLANIDPESIEGLYIVYNPLLSVCHIQSICDYLDNPNGNIQIQYNAAGCSSQEEVEEACWTGIDQIGYDGKFLIYPNPLESGATIKYNLHQSSPVTLKILDLSGREIVSLVNEVQQQGEQRIDFNTTELPAGIYFCVLKTSEGVQTTKMIKL